MKKSLVILITGLLVAGCGTGVAGNQNNNNQTSGTGNMTSKYSNSAAVLLQASVNVTGTGVDTPTDEANEKVAKISSATVTVSDEAGKTLNTFRLDKVEPSIKGEILKFDSGFVAIPAGPVKVKFDFNDSANQSLFSTEGKATLKAKTVFNVIGTLEQISVKVDSAGPETLNLETKEISDKDYKSGEMIVSIKGDLAEDGLKSLLETNGIKVTSLKKGAIKSYTVQFSAPSVAEAMIIASQTGKFEYVEQNGLVGIEN
jgi:hypothetical protein